MTAFLAALVLGATLLSLVLLGADTFRETASWTPPHVDIPPGYRIVPRAPFDWEREGDG